MQILYNPLSGQFDFVSAGAAGAAGANGIVIWDEGSFIGTGFIINFVGDGVTVSMSGSVVQVLITGTSGGGMTHSQVMARIGLR